MNLKTQLLNSLKQALDSKIATVHAAIALAKESRDSEGKSSVGDKYETGRAMMHIEIENNQRQLAVLVQQRTDLDKIDPAASFTQGSFGSLVSTNKGSYFLSIAFGKIELDSQIYYAISTASPMGKLLLGKKAGDTFMFNGNQFTLLTIA